MKSIISILFLAASILLVSCTPQLRFKNAQSATPKSLGFTNWTYTVLGTTHDLKDLAASGTTSYVDVTENATISGSYLLVNATYKYSGTYTFPTVTSGIFKSFYKYTWNSKSVTETDTMSAE